MQFEMLSSYPKRNHQVHAYELPHPAPKVTSTAGSAGEAEATSRTADTAKAPPAPGGAGATLELLIKFVVPKGWKPALWHKLHTAS